MWSCRDWLLWGPPVTGAWRWSNVWFGLSGCQGSLEYWVGVAVVWSWLSSLRLLSSVWLLTVVGWSGQRLWWRGLVLGAAVVFGLGSGLICCDWWVSSGGWWTWTGLGICSGKIYLRACLAEYIFFSRSAAAIPGKNKSLQAWLVFFCFLFFCKHDYFSLQSCYLEKQN